MELFPVELVSGYMVPHYAKEYSERGRMYMRCIKRMSSIFVSEVLNRPRKPTI
jgi:hypothetical protein